MIDGVWGLVEGEVEFNTPNKLHKIEEGGMKKLYISLLILCFFLVVPSCKKAQEEKKTTKEEGVVEKDKKLPKLSNEERKKLESLGYVE